MSLVVEESTLDDLLFASVQYLFSSGEPVSTSRGQTLETRGARLQLSNPRARVSRTSALPHMFSALAETIWYLTGDDSLDHISFYVSGYKGLIGEGTGVYGPRLFGTGDYAQIQRVVQQLTVGSTTRQAVVELFERRDLEADPRDVPCTCTLQFLLRGGRVDLIVFMRSNDVITGLRHDLFSFTFIQELVARAIGADVGTYTHFVGSLHIYEEDRDKGETFLREGAQTPYPMPLMPPGDPWPNVEVIIEWEAALRAQRGFEPPDSLAPYWLELGQLLSGYHAYRRKDSAALTLARDQLRGTVYDLYLSDRDHILEGELPDA